MKSHKNIIIALLTGLLLVGLTACEKGPAEKAGEAIDDATSDVADATEDAADATGEAIDDAASDVADTAEDAADAVEEKMDN